MGRWVTSRGRRIYIPDEGEKVPEKYKKNVLDDEVELEEHSDPEYKNVTKGVKTEKQLEREKLKKQINKDADEKEKQIAKNQKEKEERNAMEYRNNLKKEIDDFVKAHPNPTQADRDKVSAMRDKYNKLKGEAYTKSAYNKKHKIKTYHLGHA